MRRWCYSRWEPGQEPFSLDPREALDALSELLLEGLDPAQALAWMRQHGFELAGRDLRVMGVSELVQELRDEQRSLAERYRLDQATRDLERRLANLVERETAALRRAHGLESARLNDFLERRYREGGLAERIEALRGHDFEDLQAETELQALLAELESLRALERFIAEQGERFRGEEVADYETAQALRERFEALEQLARDLAEGNWHSLSSEDLSELLSEAGRESLILIRDLEQGLGEAGYLRAGASGPELTPRAIRRLGDQALAEVYRDLRKGRSGGHEVAERGVATPRPDETRPFRFGDDLDLDPVRTLLNALRRRAREAPGQELGLPLELKLGDFELRASDASSHSTTILLLDMSWSMSWAGRFPAAKRVALAMDHLIRTRFPRDDFFVVGFSTRARELSVRELPVVSWDMGDPFTNLQEGLLLAERLIARHPSPSPQVLVITDGQPTAYVASGELHVEWPMGFGGVSPRAVAETLKTVRRVTRRGITINTFMLDDAPELVGFVERMTQINAGRAFYTTPGHLGSFLMVDFVSRRRAVRR